MPTALKSKPANTKSSKKAAAKKSAPKKSNVAKSVETGEKTEKAYFVKGVVESMRDGGKQMYARFRYTPKGAKGTSIMALSLPKKVISGFKGVVEAGKTVVVKGFYNNLPAREGYKSSRAFNAVYIASAS